MADKQLNYRLTGTDVSASKTIGGVDKAASSTSAKVSATFSRLGSVVGGEVGELSSKVSEAFDAMGEAGGKSLSEKLAIGGTALAGIGAALTMLGDKDKAAEQQLSVAVKNAGGDMEEYEGKIKSADKALEKYGDTTVQTDDALTTLTNATKSPEKALDNIGVAADLAAAKHISLNDAAKLLAKGIAGSSTRIFTEYGLKIRDNADGTKDYAGAVDDLGKILHGQADAAADTFTGKLKQLRTEVEDNVAAFGQKYGPAITGVGVGMLALAPVVSGTMGLIKKFTTASVAGSAEVAAAAETEATEVAAADEAIVASNARVAESSAAATKTGLLSKAGSAGAVVGVAAVAYGVYAGGKALSNFLEKGNAAAYEMDHLGGSLKSLNTTLTNTKGNTEDAGKEWLDAQLKASGLGDKAAAAGITMDDMSEAIQGGSKSTAALVEEWKKSGKPSEDSLFALLAMANGYQTVTKKVEEHKAAEKTAVVQMTATQVATKNLAAGTKVYSTAVEKAKTDVLALGATQLSQAASEDSFKEGILGMSAAIKDNGKTLSQNTTGGLANRDMLIQLLQQAQSVADAQAKSGVHTQTFTKNLADNVAQLEAQAVKLGLSKAQVQKLVAQMHLTPKDITTKFTADTAAATKKLHDLMILKQEAAASATLTIYNNAATRSGGKKANAGGTDFFSGGATMVAERESEIIAPRGASITPVSKLQGGGDTHNYFTFNLPQIWTGTAQDLGRVVEKILVEYKGRPVNL